ncbi:MAG: primosomal protein N', partial [Deltaproteobacteria bacterium RIFCSPLOWO2_02_FULL_44_10]
MHYASIAIPARVFHPFLYRIPQNMTLTPGMRVVVPFRKRSVIGFVLELTDQLPKTIKEQSLKSVETLFDEKPVLSPALLELMQWMARYYCAPIGEVCRTMLPKRLLEIAPVLSSGRVTSPHEIAHEMQTETIPTLTEEQARALDFILKEQKKERQLRQLPILLHGITGSGKTEIYLRLIHELQTQGGDTILLVPEIGLTPQLALRVVERFGDRVAIYHSGLTDAQRFSQWKRMQNDEVDVVVGTRSALFAPLPHLQAIIVDEEHDSSYKQEEGFLYHARDVAIVRAAKENILVILGSATPSMETFANAKKGKYHYLELKKRATGASLPPVEIIDMRSSQRNGNSFQGSVSLSEKLGIEIQKRLERKEQTLLFLNRRGFSNFLLCESCGAVPKCPNCDISLTVHLKKKKLLCHYCDYALSLVKSCSECKTENLLPVGAGTERL